jgi:hypothetical protein
MITGTPLEQQKYAEYVKQAKSTISEQFRDIYNKSKVLYRYYSIKEVSGTILDEREAAIRDLAALTCGAIVPFINVLQVYAYNEWLPNMINTLTISDETAYISDEALCDCFLSPKLSCRVYVASMQKAGLNRKQMANALDAYEKHDRDKFLDVISELSPSALTMQYKAITTYYLDFAEVFDAFDIKQSFRNCQYVYAKKENKDDDYRTINTSLWAFLAPKLSWMNDIDDDLSIDELCAKRICGLSIIGMDMLRGIIQDVSGALDPIVEALTEIVERKAVKQCRRIYCPVEMYELVISFINEFNSTLPEHLQDPISISSDKDSAEEEIEEDEPQEQEGDKKGHMGFPKRTGIAGPIARKNFLHDLFVELGSDFAEMKEDWFEYLFGLGGVNRPDDYPEQFIWIEPKKEFTILLNALYGDSYAHANNLIIYKKDQKKGETKWANNAGKYTLDKDDPFRQRIVDIIKKYNKDYKP